MDLSTCLDPLKRLLMGLVIALILLLSLHGLGLGWKAAGVLALLPAVLGSLNIFAGRIYALSALVMVVACAHAVLTDEVASQSAAGNALGEARQAVLDAGPVAGAVVGELTPQVLALVTAATGALDRVAAQAPAAATAAATAAAAGGEAAAAVKAPVPPAGAKPAAASARSQVAAQP